MMFLQKQWIFHILLWIRPGCSGLAHGDVAEQAADGVVA